MDLNWMIEKVREHPDFGKIGMIASHLGVVRASSRDGRAVTRLEVKYDQGVIDDIVRDIKALPGIIEVIVDINEGLLELGDEILAVAVGGDIREHVFSALMEAVNRIKTEASRKKEFFK